MTVNLQSDGAGINSLGQTALTPQNIAVSGNVYRLAEAVIESGTSVNLGNFHVGTTIGSQNVVIRNNAINDGYSEMLRASLVGTTGATNAISALASLAPGTVNPAAFSYTVDASTPGQKSGILKIDFSSDGIGINFPGQTRLGSQTVDVTGVAYALAQAAVGSSVVDFAARRVGDAAEVKSLSISNGALPTGGFTENLTANLGGAPFNYNVNGPTGPQSVVGIAAGAAQDVALRLNTNVAGNFAGQTLVIEFKSTEVSGSGPGSTNIGGTNVALNGKVYASALAEAQSTPLDVGVVRRGASVVDLAVEVANRATGALTDVLRGQFGPVAGPFTGIGTLSAGLVAGAKDTSSLRLALNTATAGQFNALAQLDLVSHNPDIPDLSLAPKSVAVSAIVTDPARASAIKLGGVGTILTGPAPVAAAAGAHTQFTLDFGNILAGNAVTANLGIKNDVAPTLYAELLNGEFDLTGRGVFQALGFAGFAGLVAGDAITGMAILLDTMGLIGEEYYGTIILAATSSFLGLDPLSLGQMTINLHVRVVQQAAELVVEPKSLAGFLVGVMMIVMVRSRYRRSR